MIYDQLAVPGPIRGVVGSTWACREADREVARFAPMWKTGPPFMPTASMAWSI